MYLTREEERICDGEKGWAYQTSMRILVKLGELFGATKLIPIESAHIAGVSYKTLGDAPIEFLEAIVKAEGKAKTASTVNPAGFDYRYLKEMAVTQNIREKQLRIIELYKKMGIKPALTCTPYYIECPTRGSHLAWAESSAVVYANSILGSWTNREGGPSAIASALIGKTPNYGLHKPENRRPTIRVKVDSCLENESEYGALGLHLGRILRDKIPLIEGLPEWRDEELKQLGAAMAASGMTSMFLPCHKCPKHSASLETIPISKKEIEETAEKLSTTAERPDLVFIGCPHCSANEIKTVAGMLDGKKIREYLKLWVCTSEYIREKTANYVSIIENAGGRVMSGMCTIVSWIEAMGVRTLMTNSAKTAYYAPTMNKVKVRFAPLRECIASACH